MLIRLSPALSNFAPTPLDATREAGCCRTVGRWLAATRNGMRPRWSIRREKGWDASSHYPWILYSRVSGSTITPRTIRALPQPDLPTRAFTRHVRAGNVRHGVVTGVLEWGEHAQQHPPRGSGESRDVGPESRQGAAGRPAGLTSSRSLPAVGGHGGPWSTSRRGVSHGACQQAPGHPQAPYP